MNAQGLIRYADPIIAAGLWISILALLVVAATLWNVWRRDAFPSVSYGGVTLAPRRVRWLWTAALAGATLLGAARDPVVVSTSTSQDPDAEAAVPREAQSRTATTNVPLPFYRYEHERVTTGGVLVSETETRGFVLPTPLLWTLLAYLVLVIRFNPHSRWTRRVLHGRRFREGDGEKGAEGGDAQAEG